MPVELVWALSLNNALIAAPAYDGTPVFFSIEGDRLVAYDLITGTQQWLVDARPVMDAGRRRRADVSTRSGHAEGAARRRGSLAWALPFADRLAVHPVWDNGWLIVALAGGETRGYRATDGQLIWSRDLNRRRMPCRRSRPIAFMFRQRRSPRGVASRERRADLGAAAWWRRHGVLALDERIYAGSRTTGFTA